MREFSVSLSLALVVLFRLCVGWGPGASAQEPFATPGPGEFEIVPGQIARELAAGLVEEPPTGPVHFGLLRITVAPGSVFTGAADDPSVGLNLIESGELIVRLEAAATVIRTTGPEEVAAGAEFTLGPGESFIWPPNVAGELRNDGPEPVVQVVAFVAPEAAMEEAAATPLVGTPAP
jgi:hypothetical protein